MLRQPSTIDIGDLLKQWQLGEGVHRHRNFEAWR
jgi:hypothetical protein